MHLQAILQRLSGSVGLRTEVRGRGAAVAVDEVLRKDGSEEGVEDDLRTTVVVTPPLAAVTPLLARERPDRRRGEGGCVIFQLTRAEGVRATQGGRT